MNDLTYYDSLQDLRRDIARHWRIAFDAGDAAKISQLIEADNLVTADLRCCPEWQAVREACAIVDSGVGV